MVKLPRNPAERLGIDENKDLIEMKEVPLVVHWRKMRLWIREREQSSGFVYEARLLNTGGQVRKNIGKAYVKDKTFGKERFATHIKAGFKCCFCEKSFRFNKEEMNVDGIEEVDFIEAFNILCGKCWAGEKSRRGRKQQTVTMTEK